MQVKSVLDPCEDENDDIQDDNVSLGADSVQRVCFESDSVVIVLTLHLFLVLNELKYML